MTSIKYDHLHGKNTWKVPQNPLKTVGGVAETRLCLRTDGLMDGWKDGRTDGRARYYSPLQLTPWDNKGQN